MAKAAVKNRPQPVAEPRSLRQTLEEAAMHKRWPLAVLAALTGLMMWLIYAPHNIWPLAYVCLVPWLIGVVASQRRTTMFLVSYAMGVLFFFFSLNWLWVVTTWPPEGIAGVKIPIGTLLMALYLGLYVPLAAWLIRFAWRRLQAPLFLAVPVVWVATEFVRAYLPVVPYDARWQYTGLQWFFLAHSHYNVLPMIQIADLAGAYGVSFLIAMINGWLVGLFVPPAVAQAPRRWTRRQVLATTVVVAAACGTLGYGIWQLNRDNLQPGPRVAIVQTDEPLFVEAGGFVRSSESLSRTMWNLIDEALSRNPDIVVLPESMWPYRLNKGFREMEVPETEHPLRKQLIELEQKRAQRDHERLKNLAAQSGATIVVGALSQEYYPERPHFKKEKYNSVLVYRPGQDQPDRYDKMHLVLFGEFIPFRRGMFHRLYNQLNEVMPWTDEYSLTAGTDYSIFEAAAPSQGGRAYRFGSPICYEVTMSDACRQFAYGPAGKRTDLLINLSNDGWFHYSSELPQHLAVAVFRAIENRVGLARSVNTGISAAVDPKGRIIAQMLDRNGQWREAVDPPVVRSGRIRPSLPYKGFSGVLLEQIPIDPGITLYMRWGNWLPIGCMLLSASLLLAWWIDRSWIAVRHIRRGGHAAQTDKT